MTVPALPSQFELPGHIDPGDLEILIRGLADTIRYVPAGEDDESEPPTITNLYDQCNLQPTSRACYLAAQAAVSVLLAHEIGQSVGT